MNILNLSGSRRVDLIRQAESAECGLACLAMVAGFYGFKTDMSSLRQRFSISMKGTTLKTLRQIADSINLSSRPLRCDIDDLTQIRLPAILHWGGNHFVVLAKRKRSKFAILDPAHGELHFTKSDLSKYFTGIALELYPSQSFTAKREQRPLTLSSLIRFWPDIATALTQSALLSLLIEALVIASPFYLQLVIDKTIVNSDADFLNLLAISFTAVLFFKVFAITLRSLTLQFVSQALSFDMQSRLFQHMLRLPLEWFNKRHIGDIQSRFQALVPIQEFISNGAIAAILDGVLGTLIGVVMFFYSPALALLTITSMVVYLAIRIATVQTQRKLAGDTIATQAIEQTRFLEAVRAAETIKAAGVESNREGQQRNAIAASINSRIRSNNLQIGYSGAAQIIDGLTDILVVYFGAKSIIANEMTVGMLSAFLAYKTQFGIRITNLVSQFMNWRLLSVDLNRISDIALATADYKDRTIGINADISGSIRCNLLTFAYSFGDSPVLNQVSLTADPGDYIAICGPSGGGKSTLVKLIAGLYKPSSGTVMIDGRPIAAWSVDSLRRQISVVTQDDSLLAGSIFDNITFFDDGANASSVFEAAQVAQIHEEIKAMPMGYETLVGDMGSSLSGGQRQRIMIARAIYRKPRILILDEGTSHLDLRNEKAINDALNNLPITRIVVAHRPDTIRAAKKRVFLIGGKLYDVSEADLEKVIHHAQ